MRLAVGVSVVKLSWTVSVNAVRIAGYSLFTCHESVLW